MAMGYNTKIYCPAYKEFIRSKPCAVCGNPFVDFDHLKARGMGSGKQNDLTGIPLCREHHSERGQIGIAIFETRYQVNLWQVATMFLIEFFANHERRMNVWIDVTEKSQQGGVF